MTRSITTWITGDNHLNHANIIRFCHRPFCDVDEMDEAMIANWNEVVGENDTVYHLGDFSLGTIKQVVPIFWRLKGNIKVLAYPWHHDKRWLKGASQLPPHVTLEPLVVVLNNIAPVPLVLGHFPYEEWDRKHYGSVHVHAHSHGRLPTMKNRVDGGVDCWNFYPASIEQILARAQDGK